MLQVRAKVDDLPGLNGQHADACIADHQELSEAGEERGRVEVLTV